MNNKPRVSDEIISFLLSGKSMYRQKKILWNRVRDRLKISKENYNQAIYRLSRDGYIKKVDKAGYSLLEKGIVYNNGLHKVINEKPKGNKKVLVIFDIPEPKKKIREWLRLQLKWWDFKMVQKSVWVGNGPLPKSFALRLKDLGIEKSVITFTVKSDKI